MKKYKVTYQNNQKVVTTILNKVDLKRVSKKHTILHKKEIKTFEIKVFSQINKKQLIVKLNEIEMMLRANLTLYEAISIVVNSIKNKELKHFFFKIQNALKNGQSVISVLANYEKQLDPIIIALFKILHLKGNPQLIFSALCSILNTKLKHRELLVSQISYPLFLLISFFIAMGLIFYFVIPQFEYIFLQYNMKLPSYTSSLLTLKKIVFEYTHMLLFGFLMAYIVIKYLYARENAKKKIDNLLLKHIPLLSNIYRYYELHNLFLCLRILCQSHYEFNVALQNASLLLKNKYLLDRIQNINTYLQGGMSIYEASVKANIFDELVLSLIHSGQMSSNMNEALEKIEEYYKEKFTKSIKRFSSMIEPIFLVAMMLLILWVMLAIFTPIWNMSEMINL